MTIVLMIISLLLDGFITNYLPYLPNHLSLFTPLLTITTIFIITPLYHKKDKNYYIILLIFGIIYDLFYTNLLFLNALLFIGIGYISKYINKNYEITHIRLIIFLILIISIYESSYALILWIFQLVPITLSKVIYKIIHSLLLNCIVGELLYIIINKMPKKYKKISIN